MSIARSHIASSIPRGPDECGQETKSTSWGPHRGLADARGKALSGDREWEERPVFIVSGARIDRMVCRGVRTTQVWTERCSRLRLASQEPGNGQSFCASMSSVRHSGNNVAGVDFQADLVESSDRHFSHLVRCCCFLKSSWHCVYRFWAAYFARLTYGEGTLPKGVRSHMIHGVNGLDVHILEAGSESPGRPLALLLHGFPDLAYGWRHLIPILADAGYHVVAPDQRGFGRTTGWLGGYDARLEPFSLLNMTRDALGLVSALGYRRTAMLVGHDLGSPVAAYCALARPDVFPSVVLMSAPFPGPPGASVQQCGKRGIVGSTEH